MEAIIIASVLAYAIGGLITGIIADCLAYYDDGLDEENSIILGFLSIIWPVVWWIVLVCGTVYLLGQLIHKTEKKLAKKLGLKEYWPKDWPSLT